MNVAPLEIRRLAIYIIAYVALCASLPAFCLSHQDEQNEIEKQLNQEYVLLLDKYLTASKTEDKAQLSIARLYQHIETAIERDNVPQAISLIKAHQNTVTDNIDSKAAIKIIELTLDYGIQSLSDHFIKYAKQYAGSYVNANINYALSLQAYDRQEYDRTLQYLSKIDSSGSLSRSRRDYSTLLFGISLQQRSQHRDAMKIYARLGKKSKYYAQAQLNLAVAYIRQGWWTDAQIAIEKALEYSKPESQPELINRLHVVLGYSQLKNEFYRNARNSFRHVSLDSTYMSRALLGIGLCALNQKDYLGALNAFDRLEKSSDYNLTTAESHLLVPFTIERMKELDTASAGYSEAIAYYGAKIREFENYQFKDSLNIPSNDPAINILKPLPPYASHRYILLEQLQNATRGSSLETQTSGLFSRYKLFIKHIRQQQINEHLTQLRSYLSQSQYGFAKLYDENQ